MGIVIRAYPCYMPEIILCFPIGWVIPNIRTVMAIALIGMAFRVCAGRTAGFMDIFVPGLIVCGLGKIGIPDLRGHGLSGYRGIFGPYNGQGRDTNNNKILPPDQTFLEFNGQKNNGYNRDEET
jgi:hypothetical protein